MEFEPLTAQDGAVFQRVWNRVMPDQSLSPVVIRPTPQLPQLDYIAQLEGVMDDLRHWQGRLAVLSRQNGGRTALRALLEGERRQLKKLEGLYFLLTGRRYLPRGGKPWSGEQGADSLRRGFYLEMEWAERYGEMAEQLPQIGLRELAAELKEGALEQGRGLSRLV